MIASPARTARRPGATTRQFDRVLRRLLADPHVLLAAGVVPAAIGATLLGHLASLSVISISGALLIAGQLGFAVRPSIVPLGRRAERHTIRLLATTLFVGAASALTGHAGEWPLAVLFVPVIALAAALGPREAVWGTFAAAVLVSLPLLILGPGDNPHVWARGMSVTVTAILILLGTRRTVSALEGAVELARRFMAAGERQGARLGAVDEISRLLVSSGPTPDVLARIMALFESRLGYRYVSIYLGDRRRVRLGAQVGYAAPVEGFDDSRGVIGRALRTGEAQFLPSTTGDPDYWTAEPGVRSEIAMPLLAGGELLGVINVESTEALAVDDLATVRLVGDRVAAALALGREREALARRADLSRRLVDYAAEIAATLQAPAVYDTIARGAARVLEAAFVGVVVRDRSSRRFHLAAVFGADPDVVGAELMPGEGMAGRAVADRAIVVDDRFERSRFPIALQSVEGVPDHLAGAAVPLIREDVVIGALIVLRTADRPLDVLEQEMLQVLAGPAALALANAELLARLTESSLRDPLTGLFNRRYLDASLQRMQALRERQAPADRRQVAAILFDLDHFGELNKRHGHQVGDTVLRGFAEILRERFRSSDIVARYGGEEFLVLLEGASPEAAQAIAESIRGLFSDRWFEGAGEPVRVTVSAGCGATGNGVDTLAEVVRIADAGLAMAKRGGRDQVVTV